MEIMYPWWEVPEDQQKPEAPSWLINNIAELSKNARTLHTIYVGFLTYCALTIISTTDRKIILDEQAHLPVANIDVPFTAFVLVTPIIAIAVFLYFQLHLQALNAAITNLRSKYAPVEKGRLYTWMINTANEPEHGAMGKLQMVIAKLSLWWLLPTVLILIASWALKKHNQTLSYFEWAMSGVGVLLVLWLWHRSDLTLPEAGERRSFVRRLISYAHRHRDLTGFGIVFFAVYTSIFFSILVVRSNTMRWTIPCWYCVDLSNQVLVTEQKEEYSVYWVDLSYAHLERANLQASVLKRANLEFAYLEGANLREANLQGVNLNSADLKGAGLAWANLQEANLQQSHLSNAMLLGANLQKANLRFAHLEGAFFSGANLQGTDFSQANLKGADFSDVDLRAAVGLTVQRLSKVRTLYRAQLDPSLMIQIERDYHHLLDDPGPRRELQEEDPE